jgi:hypothetical protein
MRCWAAAAETVARTSLARNITLGELVVRLGQGGVRPLWKLLHEQPAYDNHLDVHWSAGHQGT